MDPMTWIYGYAMGFYELAKAAPLTALCIPFSFVGAVGAVAYFPHIAMTEAAPKDRRRGALVAATIGIAWLVVAYVLGRSMDPATPFALSAAFASMAPYGIATIFAERRFGHPLYQTDPARR